MQAGDKVRFATPEDDYEAGLVMTVLEDRGERVLVEVPVDGFNAIVPQSVFLKSDLVTL